MKTAVRRWISLVHVIPAEGSKALGTLQRGAYANVVALAPDETAFKANVQKELDSVG
jgi:hypothetical protein